MFDERNIKQTRLLVIRLEHLSVDSVWAHRASGLRGSLLHIMEKYEIDGTLDHPEKLDELMNMGYYILEQAIKIPHKKR